MMKINLPLILFFALLMANNNVFAQKSYNALIHEGNKDFEKKQYDKASSKYYDAIKKKEGNFAGHYNMGNALYKNEKFEEAKAEYQKALAHAKNADDKAAALHNLGNACMKINQPQEAAEYYKKSLKQSPYNQATRKNYEIALKKQKEQQKQQPKNEQENDKQNPNQKQNKEGDQKPNDQQGDPKKPGDKGKDQQGQGNEEDDNKMKGKDPRNDPNKNESRLPKDLEEAILNRVSNKEKETARRILNKNSYSMPESNEKDW